MSRVRTAVVVGGGIAGSVTALALRRAGIDVTVFERYETPAAGLGGTIAVAPNGLAALDIVGAAAAVAAVSQPVGRQVMSIGRRRIDLPRPADQGPLHVIRRSDLHQVLRDRLAEEGVTVLGGRRLIDVRENIALFADGSEASADVLIGADGVHSTMRRLIDPDAPGPRYTGLLAFEGLSSAEVIAPPGTMTFAFGRRAYYLYWPSPGGSTFGINLPYGPPLSIREARAVPDDRWLRTLHDVYENDDPGAELIARTTELQVNGALFIMPPVPRWHRGHMVLVGDAVHAPSNSSGQGASLAVESAVQLARCLRDAPGSDEAFLRYEALRRRRVEKIAARAARINHAKVPGKVMRAVLPVFFDLFASPEKMLGPVERYRIDWDSPSTRG